MVPLDFDGMVMVGLNGMLKVVVAAAVRSCGFLAAITVVVVVVLVALWILLICLSKENVVVHETSHTSHMNFSYVALWNLCM